MSTKRPTRAWWVAGLGLVLAALLVGFVVLVLLGRPPPERHGWTRTTRDHAARLRTAVQMYRAEVPLARQECPSLSRLVEEDMLQPQNAVDGHGHPFELTCDAGQVTIHSPGFDRVEGTEDDLSEGVYSW